MGSQSEMHRLSVASMGTSQDIQFQSNLKKWKVTNLAESDDHFETRSSSLPSSGKMRRIHSSVEPMMNSSSLASQMNGGMVSLDSITESHTPSETPSPPRPPHLIQERLASGSLFDENVTVTRVAKRRWSLMENDNQPNEVAKVKEDKSKKGASEEVSSVPVYKDNKHLQEPKNNHGEEKMIRKKRRKHSQSMNEGRSKGDLDLYDVEGEPEGEGNLHKLNRDMPKSISSLFDAVVSDIPGLASSSSSSEEEENDGVEWKMLPRDGARNEGAVSNSQQKETTNIINDGNTNNSDHKVGHTLVLL